MMRAALFLSIAVVFNVIVSMLFKQSSRADKRSAPILLATAVLLGVLNALCFTRSLAKIDLSIAYPVLAAGSMILICLASTWMFSETVCVRQTFGMALIVGGMILVCAK